MKTKFFTGKGDKGKSDLGGGKKVSKSSCDAELLGFLDELNSWMGVCRATTDDDFISNSIRKIQESIFLIQAETASIMAGSEPSKKITDEKTTELENIIKDIDKEVPKIEKFIIPGGAVESANLDYGRTLARKTERKAVELSKQQEVSDPTLKFLNRLSSVLFALARYENQKRGVEEEHPSYK